MLGLALLVFGPVGVAEVGGAVQGTPREGRPGLTVETARSRQRWCHGALAMGVRGEAAVEVEVAGG
nr:hypothetical protein [Streptomyces longwoodensis]